MAARRAAVAQGQVCYEQTVRGKSSHAWEEDAASVDGCIGAP
jgi:hypothetical protein